MGLLNKQGATGQGGRENAPGLVLVTDCWSAHAQKNSAWKRAIDGQREEHRTWM